MPLTPYDALDSMFAANTNMNASDKYGETNFLSVDIVTSGAVFTSK